MLLPSSDTSSASKAHIAVAGRVAREQATTCRVWSGVELEAATRHATAVPTTGWRSSDGRRAHASPVTEEAPPGTFTCVAALLHVL